MTTVGVVLNLAWLVAMAASFLVFCAKRLQARNHHHRHNLGKAEDLRKEARPYGIASIILLLLLAALVFAAWLLSG